jgi:hypothetical protein
VSQDDEIFAQLLDKDGRRRRNDNSEAPHEALVHSNKSSPQRQAHTPQQDVAGASQRLGHVNALPSTDEHSLGMTPPAISTAAMQQRHQLPHENAMTPGGHYAGQLQHNLIPNDAVMTQSMDGVDHELMPAPNMHFDPALETSPPPYMIYDHLTAPIHAMSFGAVKTIAITSAAIFSDKLANACQKYLNHVLGPTPAMDMESDDEESCALSTESMNVRVVRQLSATAIVGSPKTLTTAIQCPHTNALAVSLRCFLWYGSIHLWSRKSSTSRIRMCTSVSNTFHRMQRHTWIA